MSPAFYIIAFVMLLAATSAMRFRNLVHCALALAVNFAALAALYLSLGAQFVGFAQILVYVGAVAILIVFAILLTSSGNSPNEAVFAPGWLLGVVISAVVFAALGWTILKSTALPEPVAVSTPEVPVKCIGDVLMSQYVLPLEVIALLLTVAMIGAVVIALKEFSPTANPEKKS